MYIYILKNKYISHLTQ